MCNEFPCTSSCAQDLLDNEVEEIEPIKSLFADYIPNPDILNTEMSNQIGNHLFLIADAILDAQHKWEQKTYMNRINEMLNQYRFYSNFAQTLYDAGAFNTVEEVLEFIKDPTKFDRLYNLWLELGFPVKTNKMFPVFEKNVRDGKYLQ